MPKTVFFGSPVTHSEYSELRANCYRSYHYVSNSGLLVCPKFINPLINLRAFYNFISQHNDTVSGVRFYPGFSRDKLILSMCHDNVESTTPSEVWAQLDNNLYHSHDIPLINSDIVNARTLKRNYDENVYINGLPQVPGDRTRISRFYTFDEMTSLIDDNVPLRDYQNFCIQIEWGMVYDAMTTIFSSRCRVDNPNQHYGFTVLFHIKDSNGNSLIDTEQGYDPDNYSLSYLEVGTPCPPRCGII
ncbi:MAG: hypothetical protein IPL74_17795 [Bacteroidetes bacterium]|nr:hypothetical protein [Bacteroidota bacterium]